MKKLLFTLSLLLSMGAIAKAEFLGTQQGPTQALATTDYGGVRVDVSSGSSAARNPVDRACVVYGVMFSSGNSADYVTIRDTNTANTSSQETMRIYNIGTSTGGVPGGLSMGQSPLIKPIRLKNGLSWNANVGTYNFITLFYEVLDNTGN